MPFAYGRPVDLDTVDLLPALSCDAPFWQNPRITRPRPTRDPNMPTHTDRLAALRTQLAAQDRDGFVIPLTDEHRSE